MFFIAYAFKGHVHVFAGREKVVSHSSCSTSAIFKYFSPLRWYFLYLHFLASGNLCLLSVVLILDINLLSSFLNCRSLTVNVFVLIHRKTLSMAEVLHWIQPQCADT